MLTNILGTILIVTLTSSIIAVMFNRFSIALISLSNALVAGAGFLLGHLWQ